IGALDLDDCFAGDWKGDWQLAPWAQKLVERAGSYCEVTPSGNGVRILGLADGGEVPALQRHMPVGKLEIFRNTNRYICVTGAQIAGGDALVDIDPLIDALAADIRRNQKTVSDVRVLPRSNVSLLCSLAIINKHKIDGVLRHSLLNGRPRPNDDRSSVMCWQARCLHEREVPQDEAYVLINNSHWNKHAGELRNERMIWTLIEK